MLQTGRSFYIRNSINICNRKLYTPYSCSCRRYFRLRAPDQPRTYRHGCSSRIPHHRKSRWVCWECCPHCWRRHICARGSSRSWSHPSPSHFSHPHECCPCSRNHPYCRYSCLLYTSRAEPRKRRNLPGFIFLNSPVSRRKSPPMAAIMPAWKLLVRNAREKHKPHT